MSKLQQLISYNAPLIIIIILRQRMRAQNCVVRLDDGRCDMRTCRWREPNAPEATSTRCIEHQETLLASLCDGVEATREDVGDVFSSRDHSLGVTELPTRASAYFTHYRYIKIDEDHARNMLPCAKCPRRKC